VLRLCFRLLEHIGDTVAIRIARLRGKLGLVATVSRPEQQCREEGGAQAAKENADLGLVTEQRAGSEAELTN